VLTEPEKLEIEKELSHAEDARMVVPDALKIVQRRRGYVSDEALADVAGALGMTVEEVDSLATFYNLIYRRPVGRHVILICDSVSCVVTGYDGLLEHLRKTLGVDLGGTTADGRFTLLPAACLGACEIAPAMIVDGDLHGNLTPERLDEVLAKYL
jgi:NADH-quinone oxidoreductase subunit E